MLHIVTLLGDFQYQTAHLFIINFTEGAMRFNNFVVLNILCGKLQTTKWLTHEFKTHLIHE